MMRPWAPVLIGIATGFFNTSALAETNEIDRLKVQIKSIVADKIHLTAQPEVKAQVRAELFPVIEELLSLVPRQQAVQQTEALNGVWRSLWRDESQGGSPFVVADPNLSYQAFFGNGSYMNFATTDIRVPGQAPSRGSSYLFATYEDKEWYKKASFQMLYRGAEPLPDDETQLCGHLRDVIDGMLPTVDSVPDARFPRGPIGRQGEHRTLFVDQDFRITIGTNDVETDLLDLDADDYDLNIVIKVGDCERESMQQQ